MACVNKLLLIFVLFLFSCKEKKVPALNFYYWRSVYALSQADSDFIRSNKIENLYIKYFDVVFDDRDSLVKPEAIIQFKQTVGRHIPVIFIKNNVFERSDSAGVVLLADSIFRLVAGIQSFQKIITPSIQFDCDWTDKTKKKYFHFLQLYHDRSHQNISATIRLHQVKYFYRTGIPPVSKGVLMYYNMGTINSDVNENSIYNKEKAGKYLASLKNYPLQLDVALPVFGWGLLIRNNQVVHILDKIDFKSLNDTAYFNLLSKNIYLVKKSIFKGGMYLETGDRIKIENLQAQDLLEMAENISDNLKLQPEEIIFYDFDQKNFNNYERDLFKKIQARFH